MRKLLFQNLLRLPLTVAAPAPSEQALAELGAKFSGDLMAFTWHAWNGGVFAGGYAGVGGVAEVVPVDLHVPGCPPSPVQLLEGLLALLQVR